MAFSLYDATVANYLQTLGAVSGFLEKSLSISGRRASIRPKSSRRD